ncbi:MAG: LPS export ABC transporter periplasmic protein LptC [Thermodesulfobacteriota bacterium]
MDYKKIILPGAALLLAAAAVAYLALRQPERSETEVERAEISDRYDMQTQGLHHEARKNGELAWTMDAASAGFSRTDGQARIQNLRTVVLGNDGRQIVITAATGIINTRTNDMVLTGDVRVDDGDMLLLTDVLYYSDSDRIIRTETPVRISSDTMDITGDKLTFSLDTNIARLSGNVRGAFGPMNGK